MSTIFRFFLGGKNKPSLYWADQTCSFIGLSDHGTMLFSITTCVDCHFTRPPSYTMWPHLTPLRSMLLQVGFKSPWWTLKAIHGAPIIVYSGPELSVYVFLLVCFAQWMMERNCGTWAICLWKHPHCVHLRLSSWTFKWQKEDSKARRMDETKPSQAQWWCAAQLWIHT